MAEANSARSTALPSAARRTLKPTISATPNEISAAVALQARNGIVNAGMNELTSPVRRMNRSKCAQSMLRSQMPNRPATADRNADREARVDHRRLLEREKAMLFGALIRCRAGLHRAFSRSFGVAIGDDSCATSLSHTK